MQNKNGLEICGITLQMKTLLKVYKTPGPNRSGMSDLKFRVLKKRPKNGPNLSRDKNVNGPHSDSVPCIPINILMKEQ